MKPVAIRFLVSLFSCALSMLAGDDAFCEAPIFSNPIVTVAGGPRFILNGDVNNDGHLDLVTVDFFGQVSTLLGRGDGSFDPYKQVNVSSDPSAILLADFNGDGKLDIAMTSSGLNDVAILTGRGEGNFDLTGRFAAAREGVAMAEADFNEDGITDLVVLGRGQFNVQDYGAILIGRGDGTFNPPVRFTLNSPSYAMVSGDFNLDGHQDICIAVPRLGHLDITTLLGDGHGAFLEHSEVAVSSGATMETADLDGDGYLDLGIVSGNQISLLHGGSGGVFTPWMQIPFFDGYISAIRFGHLNGDDIEDIYVTGYKPIHVEPTTGVWSAVGEVLLGTDSGQFLALPRQTIGDSPTGIAIGDLNEDGFSDIAVSDSSTSANNVYLFLGAGGGNFGPRFLGGERGGSNLVMADFNGDGNKDFAKINTNSQDISLFLGLPGGLFLPETRILAGGYPTVLVTADFNHDGASDLVALTGNPGKGLSVFLNHGDATFTRTRALEGFADPDRLFPSGWMLSGEFNSDGFEDILLVLQDSGYPAEIFLCKGDGSGHFSTPLPVLTGLFIGDTFPGDLDRDGNLDLVARVRFTSDMIVLLGRGDGSFEPPFRFPFGDGPPYDNYGIMALADLNSDGYLDLVLSDGNKISFLLGDGFGHFGYATRIEPGWPPVQSIALGDMNGDGALDLVTEYVGDYLHAPIGQIGVMLGEGDMHFGPRIPFSTERSPTRLILADFNHDTRLDLAVEVFEGVMVLLNRGPYPDTDQDGEEDRVDTCTDTDHDGFGNPDFSENSCPSDNCPFTPNPSQANGDGDLLGDSCDRCPGDAQNDADKDRVCGDVDDCPTRSNPDQADRDQDGAGDVCDSCTDSDRDGFGDPGFPEDSCAPDNCPSQYNPLQEDNDRDGIADACDPCVDSDQDGFGDSVQPGSLCPLDNCTASFNPDQQDRDNDGPGDQCDNCPDVPNLEQQDSNDDGSGDACQPTVTIASLRPAGQGVLLASAAIHDPQGDPLRGNLRLDSGVTRAVNLHDALYGPDCSLGFFPDDVIGEGIVFAFGSIGIPVLADLDAFISCSDGMTDFELALGSCGNPETPFSDVLILGDDTLPTSVCIRRVNAHEIEFDLAISDYNETELHGTLSSHDASSRVVPFETRLPRRTDISFLTPGVVYRLVITVTDGSTIPAQAEVSFVYQGEQVLIIDNPPTAVASSVASVECDQPAGAVVLLDGSGSSDQDSTPGTHDEIVSFEWFTGYGLPAQHLLGTGEMLEAVLPLGSNTVVLRVTDSDGVSSTAETRVTVVDTTPPQIAFTPSPSTLWPPNHRMLDVAVPVSSTDACGTPTVVLDSITSSEPDDAPGSSDGNTSADIQGAAPGTSDFAFQLRAERDGAGGGRFYRVDYSATDSTGNRSTSSALILVPHDQGGVTEPVILAAREEPQSTTFSWNVVPGADGYQMIRGEVGRLSEAGSFIDLGSVSCIYPSGNLLTAERTDSQVPPPGRAYFYLVSYSDGMDSGYGTDTVSKPRIRTSGGCDASGIPSDPNSIAGGAGASTSGDRLKTSDSP